MNIPYNSAFGIWKHANTYTGHARRAKLYGSKSGSGEVALHSSPKMTSHQAQGHCATHS